MYNVQSEFLSDDSDIMLKDRILDYFKKGDLRSIEYKRNAIVMFMLKGISMLVSLLYVPLLLNTLDTENYGIWLTLTSIVSWVAMMDIGLGNGLRNKLATSLAQKNIQLSKRLVSSAYIALSLYIILFIIIFYFCIFKIVSWNSILNATTISKDNLNALVLVVFISFGFQFVLNLINSILLALQKPATSSFLTTLGQILSFICVLICVKIFKIHSLLVLGSIVALSPVIVLLVSSVISVSAASVS